MKYAVIIIPFFVVFPNCLRLMILLQVLLLLLVCYYCLLLQSFAFMQNETERSYEITYTTIQPDNPK